MAKRSKIAQHAYDVALPVAESRGLDLVDVEYKKEGQKIFLRLYIDKKGGVDLDDCEGFHNEVEPLIDEQVPEADEDFFEVSSPGLTRPLQEIGDYIRYEGEALDVTLYREPELNAPEPNAQGTPTAPHPKVGKTFTAAYTVEEGRIVFANGVEAELKDIAKAVRHIDF
ncbi:Putative ribosome maturation factor RimP [Ruminococcaceae bacterium YRB3002]|nr:Putative ribosome maturation factor RimP [Ruminococcaceae bacterium YRB3002]